MDEFNTFKIIEENLIEYKKQLEGNGYLLEHEKYMVKKVIENCIKIVNKIEKEKEQYDEDHKYDDRDE